MSGALRTALSGAPRAARSAVAALVVLGLSACEAEKRELGPTPPSSPPIGPNDPRIPQYQKNAYQISQGGRLFSWYGCQSCHGEQAKGAADLGDDRWRNGGSFDQVWTSIARGRADGMPAYQGRVPDEQIWQLTAYVRDLHKYARVKSRRQNLDQKGEPQGTQWSGAVR
jgi:mono/diheme cytochrome c family protein